MKPIAQMNFLELRPWPWAGLALALIAAAVLAAAAASSWRVDQSNRTETALLNQRAARLVPPVPRKLTEAERLRVTQVQSVAAELRAPWSDLLASFEEHGGADVALLKLEPDARAGVVRVAGQARNTKALFDYVQALEADPRLTQVLLTAHQAERDMPGQPLRFTVQAGWRKAGNAAKELS